MYDEFLNVSGMTAATKEEVKAAAAAKQPVFKRMLHETTLQHDRGVIDKQ